MADRRADPEEGVRVKRQKTSGEMEPSKNPYLAHMYENGNGASNGYTNGYDAGYRHGSRHDSGLAGLPRHESTAAQAQKAEDGPNNPFNGAPLSQKYFDILKVRRNLPVRNQR